MHLTCPDELCVEVLLLISLYELWGDSDAVFFTSYFPINSGHIWSMASPICISYSLDFLSSSHLPGHSLITSPEAALASRQSWDGNPGFLVSRIPVILNSWFRTVEGMRKEEHLAVSLMPLPLSYFWSISSYIGHHPSLCYMLPLFKLHPTSHITFSEHLRHWFPPIPLS